MLMVVMAASGSQACYGQEDTTGVEMQYSIEEVKITASGLTALKQKMDRILSAFESKAIELAPAENLNDILEYYISADIRGRGAEGVQVDAGIRGGTFDQTLILLNGVNLSDPQTGHHSLNLPVSTDQIERIEFLKGKSSGLIGPTVFSGAINIVTKEPDGNAAALSAVLGSYGYGNLDVAGNFETGMVAHLLSGSVKKSDGYIHNTDFKISSVYYSNLLKTDKGRMDWQAGLSEKAFGANSFYSPKYPDQFEETGSSFISGRWSSNGRFHFTPVIYYRRNTDKFMLFRDSAPEWYVDHNYHRTDTWGGSLGLWFLGPAGKTTVASEYRSENILSSLLGKPVNTPVQVPGEDAFYTKSDSRSNFSAYIEHICYFSALMVTAGGMLNYISGNYGGLHFLPGMEINFPAGSLIMTGFSWHRAMRLPTFTDLYYSGPVNIGNPLLKPEFSNTVDWNLKVSSKYFRGDAGLFYRVGHNMIDWIKYDTEDLWQSQNLTEVKSYGAELQFEADVNKLLSGCGPDNVNIGYYFNNQFKNASDFISYYVLDYLKHKFVF